MDHSVNIEIDQQVLDITQKKRSKIILPWSGLLKNFVR